MNQTVKRILCSILFIWVMLGLTGYSDHLRAQQSQSQPGTGGGISGFPATVTGGTSGGIPCFTASTTLSSSAAISANVLIKGGGAGACISASSITDNGTTVATTETISAGTSPPTNAAGTSGAVIMKEGSAFTGVSATDGVYANSTNHCMDIVNQTVDLGCIANTTNFSTASNCASSASPAACGSAPAGAVLVPTGTTSSTLQVNTTAVTANSEIEFYPDDTLGTRLSTTCNSTLATLVGGSFISARTPGTSFTITFNGTIAVNGVCGTYVVVN